MSDSRTPASGPGSRPAAKARAPKSAPQGTPGAGEGRRRPRASRGGARTPTSQDGNTGSGTLELPAPTLPARRKTKTKAETGTRAKAAVVSPTAPSGSASEAPNPKRRKTADGAALPVAGQPSPLRPSTAAPSTSLNDPNAPATSAGDPPGDESEIILPPAGLQLVLGGLRLQIQNAVPIPSELSRRALEQLDRLRQDQTTTTSSLYRPQMTEYLQFCKTEKLPAWPIRGDTVALFVEYLSRRPKKTSGKKRSRDEMEETEEERERREQQANEEQELGLGNQHGGQPLSEQPFATKTETPGVSTVILAITALEWFRLRTQDYFPQTTYPEAHVKLRDCYAVKELEKLLKVLEVDKKNSIDRIKAPGVLSDTYSDSEFLAVAQYHLTRGRIYRNKRVRMTPFQEILNLRARTLHLINGLVGFRSSNGRAIEFSDLFVKVVQLGHGEDPVTAKAYCILADNGKTNRHGGVDIFGMLRNYDVRLCAVASLAMQIGQIAPRSSIPSRPRSVAAREDLAPDESFDAAHYQQVKNAHDDLAIGITKATHACRQYSATTSVARGANKADVKDQHGWDKSMLNLYDTGSLPLTHLVAVAGGNPHNLASYFLPRAELVPPASLVAETFQFATRELANYASRLQQDQSKFLDPTCKGFHELARDLATASMPISRRTLAHVLTSVPRQVFFQDAPSMIDLLSGGRFGNAEVPRELWYAGLPLIYQTEHFKSEVYIHYHNQALAQLEAIKVSRANTLAPKDYVDAMVPRFQQLQSQHAQLENHVVTEISGVKELVNERFDEIKELFLSQRGELPSSARPVNARSVNPSAIVENPTPSAPERRAKPRLRHRLRLRLQPPLKQPPRRGAAKPRIAHGGRRRRRRSEWRRPSSCRSTYEQGRRWVPAYPFPWVVNPRDIWDEYTIGAKPDPGRPRLISIRELNTIFGGSWTRNIPTLKQQKKRRKLVCDEVQRLQKVNHWSEEQALQSLCNCFHRNGKWTAITNVYKILTEERKARGEAEAAE
ncbi:hypothetical protein DFJ74DRAFT_730430 [Hyaloraphidium curvatum]|nr:hypothetical protein DFJ74DRAFT_730430 [Hyaloraphidium curvatum]